MYWRNKHVFKVCYERLLNSNVNNFSSFIWGISTLSTYSKFKIINMIFTVHKPNWWTKVNNWQNYRTIKCEKNILVLISHNSSKETQQFIALLTGHLLTPSKIRGYLNSKETKTGRRGKFWVGNKIFRRWLVFAATDTHNLALLRI